MRGSEDKFSFQLLTYFHTFSFFYSLRYGNNGLLDDEKIYRRIKSSSRKKRLDIFRQIWADSMEIFSFIISSCLTIKILFHSLSSLLLVMRTEKKNDGMEWWKKKNSLSHTLWLFEAWWYIRERKAESISTQS